MVCETEQDKAVHSLPHSPVEAGREFLDHYLFLHPLEWIASGIPGGIRRVSANLRCGRCAHAGIGRVTGVAWEAGHVANLVISEALVGDDGRTFSSACSTPVAICDSVVMVSYSVASI